MSQTETWKQDGHVHHNYAITNPFQNNVIIDIFWSVGKARIFQSNQFTTNSNIPLYATTKIKGHKMF